MKADLSAGEVRGEAGWGGAAEESSSILPSHQLFRLFVGLNSKMTSSLHSLLVFTAALYFISFDHFIMLTRFLVRSFSFF